MSLKYIARMAGGASLEKMKKVIDAIHRKTGKSKAGLFFDMVNCSLRYGAGYYDYQIFEFYNMNARERRTYMTRVKNKRLIMHANDQSYSYIFDQKNVFDKRFKAFLGREVLDLKEINFPAFAAFVQGREAFFAKPYVGESGKGIEKIHIDDLIKLCNRNIGNKYLTPNKNLKVFVKGGQIYFIDQR